jgi:uncharacterized protein YheU (UPF0270 family)
VDDSGKIFTEHLAELPLDFVLDEGLDNGYRIKRAVDVHVLKWVRLEDQGDALLLRDNEDNIRGEAEMGEAQKHGHHEGLLCRQHSARARHEVNVGLFVI